ncbi:heterokaryon incompatibility protein [Apiospora marii]|uniref:heterokaryon incompatibility protein n=1 Tax=Apiospora marii TaxID=335849 RepID=UPI00312F76B0
MLHWHLGTCSRPNVRAQKDNLACQACGESISHQSPLPDHRNFRILSQEPVDRTCLDLSWPANVKYTQECRPSKLISESGRLENLSRYGFPPLPSRQHIRVLLSPARRWGHPLHGFLQIQDLNGRPHYEALSYTWSDESGDASLSRRMYIGPAWDVVPITRSCSRALRRLRLEDIIRPIWVDAVCINQLNNSEKSIQIALMRRIYTKSIRCVVDLGEPTTGSDQALDRVNGIAGKDDHGPVSGQPLDHGDALNNLFHRPYFRRIWIIQEITSAPQVEVTCGSRSTDLRLLKHTSSVKPAWMDSFETQIETFQSESRYEGPEGLLRLLVDTKESESSDPRDKIFALLGLVRDYQTHGALMADYDLTYAQICTGLATYYLQHPSFHYIICLRGTRLSTLPSWVPNWGSLQENDWEQFRNLQTQNEPLIRVDQWEDVLKDVNVLHLGDSLGIVRLQGHNSPILSPSAQLYAPKVHGTTGALIHEVAIVFKYGYHLFRKTTWNICTIPIYSEENGDSLKMVVTTPEPVDAENDTVAVLLRQQKFFHLRKGEVDGTYRIVGDAMLVLYEYSQGSMASSELPRDLKYWQGPLTTICLYDDHISQWCKSSIGTRELWELYVDPSGSKGITLVSARRRQYANSSAYLICYRAMNLEEVHNQYLALSGRYGGPYRIMREWVQNRGFLKDDDGSVAQLIECVLYWRQKKAWGDLNEPSRPNVSPAMISTHRNAWIIANTIRQRWLGVESILADKQYPPLEPDKPTRGNPVIGDSSHLHADRSIDMILALWEDLTDNLICRLNAIADIAGLASSLFEAESPPPNNKTCKGQFLDGLFGQITGRLGEFYKPAKSRHKRSSRAGGNRSRPKSSPLETPSPLSFNSVLDSATPSSRNSSPRCSMDQSNPCFACVDLQDTKGAVEWQAHWKVPKSRASLKAAMKTLHIQHYGDRRRRAVANEPLLRKRCLKLGMLTDLAARSLNMETVAIL